MQRQLLLLSTTLFIACLCAAQQTQLDSASQFRAALTSSQRAAFAGEKDLGRLASVMSPAQRAVARRNLMRAEAQAATPAEFADVHRGYIALGRFDDALRAARTLTNAAPLSNTGYMLQAVALKGQGHYKAALAAARESLEHPGDPTSAISFIMLNKSHLVLRGAAARATTPSKVASAAPLAAIAVPREKGLHIPATPLPLSPRAPSSPERSLPYIFLGPLGIAFLLGAAYKKPSNWTYLRDWVTGHGQRLRWYGPDTLETQEMMRSPGAAKMRDVFYTMGRKDKEHIGYGTGEAFIDAALNPKTADINNTAMEVGGFDNASVYNNGDGTATFTIPNVSGTKSFFLHAVEDRKAVNGPMTNIYQYFQWTEPIR